MRAGVLLLAAAVACGGRDRGTTPEPARDAPVTDDAPITDDSQWRRVVAHYGPPVVIAGLGASDRGNEWLPSFEGGAATEAELSRPHMAMADGAGRVYIADKEAHAIRTVDAGRITTAAGTGAPGPLDDSAGPAIARALANPNGLFVRPDGTFYVLDLDHGRVRKVQGGVTTTLFEVPGGIAIGRGLWVADDEREVLVASGSVIERWTPAGGVEHWIGGFASLGNLARDGERVLVGDRGGDRVYAVTVEGGAPVKTPIAGTGAAGGVQDGVPALALPLDGPRAVWPAHPDDGAGFFVGTHEGSAVWFIDEHGVAHRFLADAREIRSLTLDAAGNIYIVEDDAGVVRRVPRLP